jgi:predicted transcriptional regulator
MDLVKNPLQMTLLVIGVEDLLNPGESGALVANSLLRKLEEIERDFRWIKEMDVFDPNQREGCATKSVPRETLNGCP